MAERIFTDVSLVAVQVTETHRTLENDLTVTEQELPGQVTLYVVIDGGRVPLTQLRASDVLEAIDRAGKEQAAKQAATPAPAAPGEPTTPAPPVATGASETDAPAPAEPTQG